MTQTYSISGSLPDGTKFQKVVRLWEIPGVFYALGYDLVDYLKDRPSLTLNSTVLAISSVDSAESSIGTPVS